MRGRRRRVAQTRIGGLHATATAKVRGRHRLELLWLLYGQLKRVCYHMQQNEAEFQRHRRCCAKSVSQGGVLLHDWLIHAADAPKEEPRPRYHRMWGVSNKEAEPASSVVRGAACLAAGSVRGFCQGRALTPQMPCLPRGYKFTGETQGRAEAR